jgi:hypothetical protein
MICSSKLKTMPFDPATFEAEVAIKLIPTERLTLVAQDALEAGIEGPHVLRMAILELGHRSSLAAHDGRVWLPLDLS